MKKVLAVLLAVCMLAALGVSAFADASDYGWGDLDVSTIIIADGITRVEAEPFVGMTGIRTVVLPASVTSIDPDAFADSAVEKVETAGDPAILAQVAAFANAEIIQLTSEEYDEIVAEVAAEADVDEDTFSYGSSAKALLTKGFTPVEEEKKPAGNNGNYADEGNAGESGETGESESVPPTNGDYTYEKDIVDQNGNVIGTVTVTDTYKDGVRVKTVAKGTYEGNQYKGGTEFVEEVTFFEDGKTVATRDYVETLPDGRTNESHSVHYPNGTPKTEDRISTSDDGKLIERHAENDTEGRAVSVDLITTDKDGGKTVQHMDFVYNDDGTRTMDGTITFPDGYTATMHQVEEMDENGVWHAVQNPPAPSQNESEVA